jgi:hypothetical protein
VLLITVWLLVPETPVRDAARPDWAGGVLLMAGLLSALLAISEGNTWGWSSARVVVLFAGSAVLFGAFASVERSSRAPLVDMQLFAQRPAWSANLVAFAMGFALFIAGVTVPQIAALLESTGYGFGLTIAQTGMLLMPGALAIVLGGW